MRKHRTFIKSEVQVEWKLAADDQQNFSSVREWFAFLEALTCCGILPLPYGSYLA